MTITFLKKSIGQLACAIAAGLLLMACVQELPEDNSLAPLVMLAGQNARNSSTSTGSLSPIKSIQSGFTDLSTGSNTATVAISAVDTTKTFTYCTYRMTTGQPQYLPACHLSSATQLSVQYLGTCCNTVYINWYVVEFASGATVQRGIETVGTGTTSQNVGLSSVDTSKAFAIVQGQVGGALSTVDERRTFTADINGPTNLLLTRNESGLTATVYWQVVSLDGASVQSGNTTISGGTSASVPISSINIDKSFVIISARADTASGGNDADWMTRARLTSSSISLNRGSSATPVTIQYYVVQLDGSSAVQHGTSATPNAATASLTATPTNSFTASRSIPIISSMYNIVSSEQHVNANWTAAISGSQIDFVRNNTSVNSSLDWQLVEFSQ